MARRRSNRDLEAEKNGFQRFGQVRKQQNEQDGFYRKNEFAERELLGEFNRIPSGVTGIFEDLQARAQQERDRKYGIALQEWMDEQRQLDNQAARILGSKTGDAREILGGKPVTEVSQEIHDMRKPYDIRKLQTQNEKRPVIMRSERDMLQDVAMDQIIRGCVYHAGGGGDCYGGILQEKYGESE